MTVYKISYSYYDQFSSEYDYQGVAEISADSRSQAEDIFEQEYSSGYHIDWIEER